MAREIPLRNKNRVIVAHAIVDDEDFARVSQYRWSLAKRGYVYRRIYQGVGVTPIEVKLHRYIMGAGPGDPMVDHRDRDKLNNCRGNLRSCTAAENNTNRIGDITATSIYRGVSWDKGTKKWRAQHMLGGKTRYIGIFASEDDAGEAARLWRLENMPFSEELLHGA